MKKLLVMFLGIFLVFSLVGCGGGGGGGKKKDEKGVTMDQATIVTQYKHVLDVQDGLDMTLNLLSIATDDIFTDESTTVKIMSEGDGEGDDDDKSLNWSTTPDSNGWYTAIDEGSYSDGIHSRNITHKIRLLSSGAIEYSYITEYKAPDVTEIDTDFMRILKGNNGLWNGYKTNDSICKDTSDSESSSSKITFNNLDTNYGTGSFILSSDEGSGEFVISRDGANFKITGTLKVGDSPISINKTLTPEDIEKFEDGEE